MPSEVNQMDTEPESGSTSRTPVLSGTLASSVMDDPDDSMDGEPRFFASVVNNRQVRPLPPPPPANEPASEPREPSRARTRTSSFSSVHDPPPVKRPKTPDAGWRCEVAAGASSTSECVAGRLERSPSAAAAVVVPPLPPPPPPTAIVSSLPVQAVPHEDPEIESWLGIFRVSSDLFGQFSSGLLRALLAV